MADTKISALPSGAPAQAGDEYVIARSGANYKLTLTNIAASMPPIGATTPNTGAFTTLSASGNTSLATLSASGAASFADGSASVPAVTNTGDTDTGVYFPAANEVAVTTGGTVAAAFNSNGLFFRNRIINGDMRIAQRGTAAVTINAGYAVDRWFFGISGTGAYSGQQDSSVPTGFINSVKCTVTTAQASLGATEALQFQQRIEGNNFADLGWGTANARTVTLSFWVRSSLTGTFGGSFRNSAQNRSYPFTYTILVADTWEYKTVTVSGDTTGTWETGTSNAVNLTFGLGAGTDRSGTAGAWAAGNYVSATGTVSVIGTLNATWYVTGVQLETGSVATPFERRPYGTELMLCQRYYQELGAAADTAITYQAYAIGAGTYYLPMALPVPMRAAPTGTIAGTWGTTNLSSSSIVAGVNAFRLNLTAAGAGNFSITNNGAGSKLTFAIEL